MKPLVVVTHDSTFHTDDVFACAVITMVFTDRPIEITRSRDTSIISRADVVLDTGGEYDVSKFRFDHHQPGGAGMRANGIPYATFGLVWKEYGAMVTGSEASAQLIDERLVQQIDAHDNGIGQKHIEEAAPLYVTGDIISSFRPAWREDRDMDKAFMEAMDQAIKILERLITHTNAYITGSELVHEAYKKAEDKRLILMEDEYPGWSQILTMYPEPLFVAYRRIDGKWSLKGVPAEPQSFVLRKQLPEPWAGLRGRELEQVTGVRGSVFCHNNRFLVVAETQEAVLQLFHQAVE